MLVFAADTSGKHGSIALARCSQPDVCQILDVADLAGGTFSAQLVPQIAALLSQHGLTKTDMEGLAIVSGPGSFTGLRIGLAAIKALGEVLAKPIVALSMLEIVARAGLTGGRCLAAMDAGRNEVYVGNFDGQRLGTERLLTMSEFLLLAQDIPVVTADSNIANAARSASLVFEEIARPRADSVARLGWGKNSGKGTGLARRTRSQLHSPCRRGNIFRAKIESCVLVRSATAADIPLILQLEREAPTAAHWSPAHYHFLFPQPSALRLALVIEDEQSARGFLVAHRIFSEWEIENILVAAPARRRGFASELMRTLLDTARREGAQSIFLEVRESNRPARAFYEKLGFQHSGRRAELLSQPR